MAVNAGCNSEDVPMRAARSYMLIATDQKSVNHANASRFTHFEATP